MARRRASNTPSRFSGNVLREKAQNQVALLLEQTVPAAIVPVGDGICRVLRAIEFDRDAQLAAEQVDFHLAPAVERDGQCRIQQEQPLGGVESLGARQLQGAAGPGASAEG